MAVRSFQQMMNDYEATKKPHVNVPHTETVYQGRAHAPPVPSFNNRVADDLAGKGIITPHQRYVAALQQDVG